MNEQDKKKYLALSMAALPPCLLPGALLMRGQLILGSVLVVVVAGVFFWLRQRRSEYLYGHSLLNFALWTLFGVLCAVGLLGDFLAVVLSIALSYAVFPFVRKKFNYVNPLEENAG